MKDTNLPILPFTRKRLMVTVNFFIHVTYVLNTELCKCSNSSRAFVSNMTSILSNVSPRFVNVNLKVKVILEQAMEAQRGIEV